MPGAGFLPWRTIYPQGRPAMPPGTAAGWASAGTYAGQSYFSPADLLRCAGTGFPRLGLLNCAKNKTPVCRKTAPRIEAPLWQAGVFLSQKLDYSADCAVSCLLSSSVREDKIFRKRTINTVTVVSDARASAIGSASNTPKTLSATKFGRI